MNLDTFLWDREALRQDPSLISKRVVSASDGIRRDFAYLFQGPPATRKIVKKQVSKFEKQTARPDRLKAAVAVVDVEKELNALYNKLTSQNAEKLSGMILEVYNKQRVVGKLSIPLLEVFWKHMTEQSPANHPAYVKLLKSMVGKFPETMPWLDGHIQSACSASYYTDMPPPTAGTDDYDEFCEYRVWRKRHFHEILFWFAWKGPVARIATAIQEVLQSSITIDHSQADSLVEWFVEICKKTRFSYDPNVRSKTSAMASKIKFRWMALDDALQNSSSVRHS